MHLLMGGDLTLLAAFTAAPAASSCPTTTTLRLAAAKYNGLQPSCSSSPKSDHQRDCSTPGEEFSVPRSGGAGPTVL
jgi:hypothetical protein